MTDQADHDAVTKTARSIIANPAAPRSFSSVKDLARRYLEATEWRPIEEAPRDGSVIDVWMINRRLGISRRIPNSFWGRYEEHSKVLFGDYHWVGCDGDDEATHYLPLPQPPKVMK